MVFEHESTSNFSERTRPCQNCILCGQFQETLEYFASILYIPDYLGSAANKTWMLQCSLATELCGRAVFSYILAC